MILNCPNCSAQYTLPDTAFDDGGRDVRCAKCKHQWFASGSDQNVGAQDDATQVDAVIPEDVVEDMPQDVVEANLGEDTPNNDITDDLSFLHDMDGEGDADSSDIDAGAALDEGGADNADTLEEYFTEKIPEGVKPTEQDKVIPALGRNKTPISFQAKLTGMLAALVVFSMLVVTGFVLKQKIVTLWSPAAAIYELAGLPVHFKGENLIMESLSANVEEDVDGRDYLLLQGRVINLTNEAQAVPKLIARLRNTNGEDGDSWEIEPPLDVLEPGDSFTFKSDYPALPRDTGSVNLTLLPSVL